MGEHLTWRDKILNRFFAVPAVAQAWARQNARRTQALTAAEPVPFAALRQPLDRCRAALITTAGIHLASQAPFDMGNPDGDASYRLLPVDAAAASLRITHKYYDHTDADSDLNVVFPLTHFRDLAARGVIGSLAQHHVGFMGHIDGQPLERLVQATAPEVAAKLRDDGVDFAFLTPA